MQPIDLRIHTDDIRFIATLRSFWSSGVLLVSPGAFGMVCYSDYNSEIMKRPCTIGCEPRPLERCDMDPFVRRCAAAQWITDEVGNDWIVQNCTQTREGARTS